MKNKTTKVKKNRLTNMPKKEAEELISQGVVTPVEQVKDRGFDRPKLLKSGLCIICNDPVNQEPAVYNYACHSDCATASGDSIIRQRIKELVG